MQIQILKIHLQNFKGIQDLEVELGKNTSIWGDNATGKTTIEDAFMWCLFGKDSQNKADFEIKTLDAQGEAAHNLEHSVELLLDVDGRKVAMKKTYSEKWTKRRGQAKAEFTGHTVDHFFEGVPVKEKEYQERIKGLAEEGVFRLLTDPRYFNEVLKWQDRRSILMEICGDISVQDVIASDSSLAGLESILNGHGIEDAKKIIAGKRKEINEQLEKIPVRIDEATRSKAEIREDIDTVPGQIKALENRKADLESQLSDLNNGGALSRKRIELQEVEGEILRMRNSWEEDKRTLAAPLQRELDGLQEKSREYSRRVGNLEIDLSIHKKNKEAYERELVTLREEWNRVDAQEIKVTDTCPTCGQALPDIQVGEAREKANQAKAQKLADISTKGKGLKAKATEYEQFIVETEAATEKLKAEWKTLEPQEDALKKKLEDIRSQLPDLTTQEQKKASIQAEIDNIQASEKGMVDEAQGKLSQVQAEIMTLQADLQRAKNNEAAETRIAELLEQEKKLGAEFENLEADLFKVENFIRAKVALLEERINGKFDLVRFKLFEDQINGGLQEVCITTLGGVPYGSINNAGRIQAGMDIIKTLQRRYGITASVWIDNAESIVELPKMDCQIIRLVVSEQDKTLRIVADQGDTEYKKAGGM